MKKWIVLFLAVTMSGLIFWSCSDDDKTTEPTNKVPTCTISSPADNAAFTIGNNITVNVTADDEDGNVFEVRFYFDGTQVGSDQSSPYSYTISTGSYTAGTHTIKAIAKDNEGAETAKQVNINLTTVANTAPEITSLTASATSVLQGGTSTLTCTAIDANPGDILTYTWTKTGGSLSSTTGTSTTWTAPTVNGTYTITCTVSDGIATDSDSKAITVTDYTPPSGFVFVQGGTFTMGDNLGDGYSDELPLHSVTLSDFYIGATEVTQAEWTATMGSNPASGYGVGDTYPVYYVSWYSIMKYCNLRSMNEGLTPVYTISSSTDPADWGTVPTDYNTAWDAAICNWNAKGYRLPSEAEWEYAARGGLTGQRFPNGATISHSTNGDTQANYYADPSSYSYDVSPTTGYHPDYNGTSSPVGSFPANGYGLYDMSGNLFEWCWDWYGSYTSDSVTNPYGPTTGSSRVRRGGRWYSTAGLCRVADRNGLDPYYSNDGVGFRLSRTP